MKALRKLISLFAADRAVLVAVPVAVVLAWVARGAVPAPVLAMVLLGIIAVGFAASVLKLRRAPPD